MPRSISTVSAALQPTTQPVDTAFVRRSYEADGAVAYYVRAVEVGLWRSEQLLIRQWFRPHDRILDLGCGAGRTTFGLVHLGYQQVTGVDLSPRLIEAAQALAAAAGITLSFTVADALDLPFPDESFDAALFSFNGLMQIPGREHRIRALCEVRRVLRPGGVFLFSTHDRDLDEPEPGFWRAEWRRWRKGKRDPRIPDFGGMIFDHQEAETFLHIPNRAEVLTCLAAAGFHHLADYWRPNLVEEPPSVLDLSRPCRFWVTRR